MRQIHPLYLLLLLPPVQGQSSPRPVSFEPPVTFVSRGSIVGISRLRGLIVGDFNGDGAPDLVVVDGRPPYPGSLAFYLGKGDGSFSPRSDQFQYLVTGYQEGAVAASDFNGDGRLDLAVEVSPNREPFGPIAVYFGKGDGTFFDPVLTPRDRSSGSQGPFFVADVNRDGKPDIISGQFVYFGHGNGTFQQQVLFAGIATLVADFNADSVPDVLLKLPSGQLGLCLGRGDGTFGDPLVQRPPFAIGSVVAADFDGDGHLDLLIAPAVAPDALTNPLLDLWMLTGHGDGTFGAAVVAARAVPAPVFAAVDMNHDGLPDLVSGNSVLLGVGHGAFSPPVFFGVTNNACFARTEPSFQAVSCQPQSEAVVVADFNCDGLPDVVSGYSYPWSGTILGSQDYVSISINNSPGDGLFTAGVSSANGTWPVAENSLVTAFGTDLAPVTESAATFPLPTTLGGVRVHITFSCIKSPAGQGCYIPAVDLLAPLLYVSPGQINYVLVAPEGYIVSDTGSFAFVTIERVGSVFAPKGMVVPLQALAPGLFTLNSAGLAVALATRSDADGTRTPVPAGSCSSTGCVPNPIDVSSGPITLSLYGTGFSSSSSSEVGCDIGALHVSPAYVGPEGAVPGLDRIDLPLPPGLAGAGDVTAQCRFAITTPTNPVRISIQ